MKATDKKTFQRLSFHLTVLCSSVFIEFTTYYKRINNITVYETRTYVRPSEQSQNLYLLLTHIKIERMKKIRAFKV